MNYNLVILSRHCLNRELHSSLSKAPTGPVKNSIPFLRCGEHTVKNKNTIVGKITGAWTAFLKSLMGMYPGKTVDVEREGGKGRKLRDYFLN